MDLANLKIGFYIRGETPRTINKQYLTLQQFCYDFQVPYEDVTIIKDMVKSNEPRPNLQQVLDGSVPIQILVVQSYHILHIDCEQFTMMSEQLSEKDIALLLVNVLETGDVV